MFGIVLVIVINFDNFYLLNHIFIFYINFPALKAMKKQPPEVSYKKDVLKNFPKFTEKHLCQSLFFNDVVKKKLWHRCFLVTFAKSFKNSFFKEHLRTTASGNVHRQCKSLSNQNPIRHLRSNILRK